MHNRILIALFVFLLTMVAIAGCKPKNPQPSEQTMGSTEQLEPEKQSAAPAQDNMMNPASATDQANTGSETPAISQAPQAEMNEQPSADTTAPAK
ncbi:MAG: hypothetical protein L0Z73_14105 [Gammaproteobacteria bacterium]|nr:hypothetical protein [Gammaproteobacteria bacterium]